MASPVPACYLSTGVPDEMDCPCPTPTYTPSALHDTAQWLGPPGQVLCTPDGEPEPHPWSSLVRPPRQGCASRAGLPRSAGGSGEGVESFEPPRAPRARCGLRGTRRRTPPEARHLAPLWGSAQLSSQTRPAHGAGEAAVAYAHKCIWSAGERHGV